MNKCNCCFWMLFVGCASLWPAQIQKKGFLSKPDLTVVASLADPSTRKMAYTIKNSEFTFAKIETAFLALFWDPKNTTHRIERRFNYSAVNSNEGYRGIFLVPDGWPECGIKVDSSDVIEEKDENNNSAFVYFAKPDLTVSTTIYDQEMRTLRYQAKNIEFPDVAISRSFKIVIWDTKATSNRSEFELSPANINLATGHTDYFPIPGAWSFQVGIKVDSANSIEEAKEDNNIAFAELSRADLIITAEINNQAQRKIKYTFKNIEYAARAITKPVKIKIWDTVNTTNVTNPEYPAATANHAAGFSMFFTIPASWSSHIGLKIDSEDSIEEKDEANNFAYVHF